MEFRTKREAEQKAMGLEQRGDVFAYPHAHANDEEGGIMNNPSRAGAKRRIDGLAERVVALRKERGLSQQVLATRAGISIPRLADVERYGAATTATLNRLAKALKVGVDVLLERQDGAVTRLDWPKEET